MDTEREGGEAVRGGAGGGATAATGPSAHAPWGEGGDAEGEMEEESTQQVPQKCPVKETRRIQKRPIK